MLKAINKQLMHCYPGMVAIVTVSHKGEDNVMAAGWHSYLSYEPPIYGVAIGPERYTHHLVKESGKYAINFLPHEKANFIQQAGTYTGSSINKFKKGEMDFVYGLTTGTPILQDAYVVYECEVFDFRTYGDHDWFVGNIVQFHVDQEKFQGNGLPEFDQLSIPLYLGRSIYTNVNQNSQFVSHRIIKEQE